MADAGPDGLMSAPPGVDQDAGSANTIAATIEAAKVIGMARVLELSQDTLAAGSRIGDALPLTPSPTPEASMLQPAPDSSGPQGGDSEA
jgi:hypothetical protein